MSEKRPLVKDVVVLNGTTIRKSNGIEVAIGAGIYTELPADWVDALEAKGCLPPPPPDPTDPAALDVIVPDPPPVDDVDGFEEP